MDTDSRDDFGDDAGAQSTLTPISSTMQLVSQIMAASTDLGEVRWIDSVKTLAHILTSQSSEAAEEDAEGDPRSLLPPLSAACAKASAAVYLTSRRAFKAALAPMFSEDEVVYMQLKLAELRPAHALLVSRRYHCIFVVIKGTSSLGDLLADLAGRSQPFFGGGCHTGMAACVNALMQREYGLSVITALQKSGDLPLRPPSAAVDPKQGRTDLAHGAKENEEIKDNGAADAEAESAKADAPASSFPFSGKSVAAALSSWAGKRVKEKDTAKAIEGGKGDDEDGDDDALGLPGSSGAAAVASSSPAPAAAPAAGNVSTAKSPAAPSANPAEVSASAAPPPSRPAEPMYRSGLAAVLWELLRVNPGYNVVLTGHSLGAGIAAILAVTLRACLYYRFAAEGQRLPWEAAVVSAAEAAATPGSPALRPVGAAAGPLVGTVHAASSFQLLSPTPPAAAAVPAPAASPAVSPAAGSASPAPRAAKPRVSTLAPAVAACLCPIALNAVGIATPASLCPQMGALVSLTAEEATALAADLSPAESAASAAAATRILAVQAGAGLPAWPAAASASAAAPAPPPSSSAPPAAADSSSADEPFRAGDEAALALVLSSAPAAGGAASSSGANAVGVGPVGGPASLLRRYDGTLHLLSTQALPASMRRWPLVSSLIMQSDVVPRLTIAAARALHAEITEPSRVARATAELSEWMRQGVDDRRQRMWAALPAPLTTRVEVAAVSVSSGWRALALSTGAAIKGAGAALDSFVAAAKEQGAEAAVSAQRGKAGLRSALDTLVARARFGASGAVLREEDVAVLYALQPPSDSALAVPVASEEKASAANASGAGATAGAGAGASVGSNSKYPAVVALPESKAEPLPTATATRKATAVSASAAEDSSPAPADVDSSDAAQLSLWARILALRPGAAPMQKLTRFNSPSVGDTLPSTGSDVVGAATGGAPGSASFATELAGSSAEHDDSDDDDDDDDDGVCRDAGCSIAAVGLTSTSGSTVGCKRHHRVLSASQARPAPSPSPLAAASDAAMLAAAAQATMNPTAPISAQAASASAAGSSAAASVAAAAAEEKADAIGDAKANAKGAASASASASGSKAAEPVAAAPPPPSPAEVALMRRLRLLVERCPLNATDPSQQLICPGLVYHMTKLTSKEATAASAAVRAAGAASARPGSVAADAPSWGSESADAADPLAGVASPKAAASLHCGMAIVGAPPALTRPTPADAAAAVGAAASASATAGSHAMSVDGREAASAAAAAAGAPAPAAAGAGAPQPVAAVIADSVEADVAAGRFRVHVIPPRRLATIRVSTTMISDHSKEQYAAAAEALSLRTGVLDAAELASLSADYAARCKAEEEARRARNEEHRRKFMVPAAAGAAVGVAAAGVGAVVAAPVLATVAAASLAAAGTVAAASAVAIHYDKTRKRDSSNNDKSPAPTPASPAAASSPAPASPASAKPQSAVAVPVPASPAVDAARGAATTAAAAASAGAAVVLSNTKSSPAASAPAAGGASSLGGGAAAAPATPQAARVVTASASASPAAAPRSASSRTPAVGMGLGGRLLQGVTGLFGRGSAQGAATQAAGGVGSPSPQADAAAGSGNSGTSASGVAPHAP